MKPLTIEELKDLEVGNWVWVELIHCLEDIDRFTEGQYVQIHYGGTNSIQCYKLKSENEVLLLYSDYGTKWLAYKNKEQAEGSNEIMRFVEYVGSKIAGHSDYHGDNILSALYCAAEGKEIQDVAPLKARGEIVELPCKLGQKIYEIYNDSIYEYYASEVTVHEDGRFTFETPTLFPNRLTFGEDVFIDKSEAERRLAKKKEDIDPFSHCRLGGCCEATQNMCVKCKNNMKRRILQGE